MVQSSRLKMDGAHIISFFLHLNNYEKAGRKQGYVFVVLISFVNFALNIFQ